MTLMLFKNWRLILGLFALDFSVHVCSMVLAQNDEPVIRETLPKPVQVRVRAPIRPYPGFFIDFQRQVLDENLRNQFLDEYNRRIGTLQNHNHILNNKSERDEMVFNPYSGTYVNLRDEQRGFAFYMYRKMIDTTFRTTLRRPEFKEVRKAHERVEKVTNVRVEITPAKPGSPPRIIRAKYDVVTNRANAHYSGPEGNLDLSTSLSTIEPLAHYSVGLGGGYSAGVSYNIIQQSYGTNLTKTLRPDMRLTGTFNGNIPKGANVDGSSFANQTIVKSSLEFRTMIEFNYVF